MWNPAQHSSPTRWRNTSPLLLNSTWHLHCLCHVQSTGFHSHNHQHKQASSLWTCNVLICLQVIHSRQQCLVTNNRHLMSEDFFFKPRHSFYFIIENMPWLVWLSGLSAGLWSKGSLVPFLVRAHAWVAGQVPSEGAHDRQPHTDVSLPFSLPSPLKMNK